MSNPPVLADFHAIGQGLEIWCCQHGCQRMSYWTAEEAVSRLGPQTTIEEAQRRLSCVACGAKGRERLVRCRPSPTDYSRHLHRTGP